MRTFTFVAATLLVSVPIGAQAPPSPTDLANRIQARYATVRDFTADFTQSSSSPLSSRPSTDRGQLKIKKPDRMRWTYTTSDKNVVVADGSRLYYYFPRDKYVTEEKLPAPTEAPTAFLFLAGRTNLARDFVATVPAAQPEAEWRLVLAPKKAGADFKTITLDVDRTSYALMGFSWAEEDGAVTSFRLANIRENVNLPDADFTFAIPRGVEVRRQ